MNLFTQISAFSEIHIFFRSRVIFVILDELLSCVSKEFLEIFFCFSTTVFYLLMLNLLLSFFPLSKSEASFLRFSASFLDLYFRQACAPKLGLRKEQKDYESHVCNRGENKNDVGVMYVISNALRTKILTKNGVKKYKKIFF